MGKDETGIPSEFVLKQIENEIDAGFAFVDAASRFLKLNQKADVESRQFKADGSANSAVDHVRIVTHRLNELREAVDLMLEMHLEAK